MNELYWIWSNDRQMYWGPDCTGYAFDVRYAGKYPLELALKICRQGNVAMIPDKPANEMMVPVCKLMEVDE